MFGNVSKVPAVGVLPGSVVPVPNSQPKVSDRERMLSRSVVSTKGCELTVLATEDLLKVIARLSDPKLGDDKRLKPTHIVDMYVDAGKRPIRDKFRYLHRDGEGGQYLRVRKEPISDDPMDRGLWVKTTDTLTRDEYTAEQPTFPNSRGKDLTVRKDRYKVLIDGWLAHVYVYHGRLCGLVTVSFRGLTPKTRAELRDDISVTDNTKSIHRLCIDPNDAEVMLNGCRLAGHSYGDLAADLANTGYTKLQPRKFGLRDRVR